MPSKIVPVRFPEDVIQAMDKRTENRSALVVAAVRAYLGEVKEQGTVNPRPIESKMIIKKARPIPEMVIDRQSLYQQPTGCKECGALSGHQKWCSKR